MFVLYVAGNLLDDVFQRDDAAGASELIDHHAQRLLLLQEDVHQFACSHRFRHVGHFADMLRDVGNVLEQF